MPETEKPTHGAEAVFAALLPFLMAAAAGWIVKADLRLVILATLAGLLMGFPVVSSWLGWSKKHPGVAATLARYGAASIILAGLWLHKTQVDAMTVRLAPFVADSTTRANAPRPTQVGQDSTTAKTLARLTRRNDELGRRMRAWRQVVDKCQRLETSSEPPDIQPLFEQASTDSAWLAREFNRPTAEEFGEARDPQTPIDRMDAWWIVGKWAQAKFEYLSRLR